MNLSSKALKFLTILIIAAQVITAQTEPNFDWYDDTKDTFYIENKDELLGLAQLVNGRNIEYESENFEGKTIILKKDIELNDTTGWQNWGESFTGDTCSTIGYTSDYWFDGTFDGGGYTISGLFVSSEEVYAGFFGYIGEFAEIKNLNLSKVFVEGVENVGGLVGENGGTITNCSVDNGSTIEYDGGEVISSIGGLVGSNFGEITNCYAAVKVFSRGYVGGLVGQNMVNGKITNSYAIGDVSGNSIVGGLVGYNENDIINSYATGNVSGNDSIGGLVGYNYNNGEITNSYATGKAFGHGDAQFVGGLVGNNVSQIDFSIVNCFYNKDHYDTSGTMLDDWMGTAKTLAEMKLSETYFGDPSYWERSVWGMHPDINEGFPYLVALTEKVNLNVVLGDNFDPIFKAFIQDTLLKKGGDSTIYDIDVDTITVLDLRDKGIKNLNGIEYFTSLVKLDISNTEETEEFDPPSSKLRELTRNSVSEIDLSRNVNLKDLNLSGNNLEELDLSENLALVSLDASDNALRTVKLPASSNLVEVNVKDNLLTELDLSANINLEKLDVSNNEFESKDYIIGVENSEFDEIAFIFGDQNPTPINKIQKIDSRYGIKFDKNIASDEVKISVILENNEKIAKNEIVIYDMASNVVYKSSDNFVWNLRNQNGRFVANGTYLVVAKTKSISGRTSVFATKLGVKK